MTEKNLISLPNQNQVNMREFVKNSNQKHALYHFFALPEACLWNGGFIPPATARLFGGVLDPKDTNNSLFTRRPACCLQDVAGVVKSWVLRACRAGWPAPRDL